MFGCLHHKAGVWEIPVSHILVDEFQDINVIQLAWVEEHYKRGAELP